MGTGKFGNTGNIVDQTLDQWFKDYEGSNTEKEALSTARKIFDRVSDKAYFLPICIDTVPVVANKKVGNFVAIPDFMMVFDRYWIKD